MDFLQRGTHQNQTVSNSPSVTEHHTTGGRRSRKDSGGFLRYITVALLFALTVLVVVVIFSIFLSKPKNEDSYVDKGKFQAVFLNNGQVYFGKIDSLNTRYIQLKNIYYLRVNQTVQPNQSSKKSANDVSLVKLGCELHGPSDEMLINREQVTFWENLKSDGQVAKAVSQYLKSNPNGQNCSATSNSSSSSSNNSSSNGSNSTNTNQ